MWIRNRDAFEQLAFRTNAAHEPDQNALIYGTETVGGRIDLQKIPVEGNWFQRLFTNPWRITQIAKYGVIRTADSTLPSEEPGYLPTWTRLSHLPTYTEQIDDTLCQSAALQMVISRLKPSFNQEQHEIRDALSQLPGGFLSHEARQQYAQSEIPSCNWTNRYESDMSVVIEGIKQQLQDDIPVLLNTRLTPSGHVIVITGIGLSDSGTWQVEADDPAGCFDFFLRKFNGSGERVKYDLSKLFVRTQTWSNGNHKTLAFFVVGEDCWTPPLRQLVDAGNWPTAQADTDWEWLSARPKALPAPTRR